MARREPEIHWRALTARRARTDPRPVLDRALRWTSHLLATAPAFAAVQHTLSFTLTARRALDRALDAAWAAANVPSIGDLERLRADLAEARATIDTLERRVRALADAREEPAPPRR